MRWESLQSFLLCDKSLFLWQDHALEGLLPYYKEIWNCPSIFLELRTFVMGLLYESNSWEVSLREELSDALYMSNWAGIMFYVCERQLERNVIDG